MKPAHKPAPRHDRPQTLSGVYRQPIFSPKGTLEGVLLEVDGAAVQIVLAPHEAAVFDGIALGQMLAVRVTAAEPPPKGEAAHAVHDFVALEALDGKPRTAAATPAMFEGVVERLNYAKHGEPNGVVLDSGHFIHLRPPGFRTAGLAVGDRVRAKGEARPMVNGYSVVEATHVNGVAIEPKKPKPPKHGKPHHGPHGHHPHGPHAH